MRYAGKEIPVLFFVDVCGWRRSIRHGGSGHGSPE